MALTEYERRKQQRLAEDIRSNREHLLAIILDSDAILDKLLDFSACRESQLYMHAEWLREMIDRRVDRVAEAILEEPSSFRRAA